MTTPTEERSIMAMTEEHVSPPLSTTRVSARTRLVIAFVVAMLLAMLVGYVVGFKLGVEQTRDAYGFCGQLADVMRR